MSVYSVYFILFQVNGGRGYPVYTLSGNQDQYWHLAQIEFGQEYTKSSFQVCIIEINLNSQSFRYKTIENYGEVQLVVFLSRHCLVKNIRSTLICFNFWSKHICVPL